MQEPELTDVPVASGRLFLRLALGGALLAAMAIALILGASPDGMIDVLSQQGGAGWIADHLLLASLAYAVFYMFAVTVSMPGALWFTIIAGFLLGSAAAIPVSLFGISFGAATAWLMMRYLAGPRLRQRFSSRIARFADGFHHNEFAYVVLLRVLPLPFFLVNLAAALLGHRLRAFSLGR